MKRALNTFAVLITVGLLAMVGSLYYLHYVAGGSADFVAPFTPMLGSLKAMGNALVDYVKAGFPSGPQLLPKIVVTVAVGIIVIVDFLVLFKVMRLRKPFVSYLTFLNILFVALIGIFAFIPFTPHLTGYTGTELTVPTVITQLIMYQTHGFTSQHAIAGYAIFGSIAFFALFNLLFVIVSFVDIAKTPFPVKKVKKVKSKKAKGKKKSDRDVVADEFGTFQVPSNGKEAAAPSPSIHEIRHAVKEEIGAARHPEPQVQPAPTPAPERIYERIYETRPQPQPEPAPAAPSSRALSLEEIRAIIRDELDRNRGGFDSFRGAPVIYAAPTPFGGGYPYPYPYPYPPQQPAYYPPQQYATPGVTGASKEEVRNIVTQELEKNVTSKKDIVSLIEQEVVRLSPTSKESVYSIVNEELIKYDALNREALDSLVAEKVDRSDALNRSFITEEFKKYDADNKAHISNEISKKDEENRARIRAIFADELQKYDESNKEVVHHLIAEELEKRSAEINEANINYVNEVVDKAHQAFASKLDEQLVETNEVLRDYVSEQIAVHAGPQASELRVLFNEEIERYAAKKPPVKHLTVEEVKQIVAEELAKVSIDEEQTRAIVAAVVDKPHLNKEDVVKIVHEQLAQQPQPPSGPKEDELRQIFAEEIARVLKARQPAPQPAKVEPEVVVAPVKESAPVNPFVAPVKKEAPAPKPKVVAPKKDDDDEDDEEGKGGIIRVPFQQRMKDADKVLKTQYNILKNYILSYGVKSRVSNTGDTFRIHRETYVKITIAGKGLKLYFALNPKDYDGSTIPVQSVAHKAVYSEIPTVLKVRSDLAVKRAMTLIDDVMTQKGRDQGDVHQINWAKDFK